MTLSYTFDGIMCDVLDNNYTHFYDEPNYSRERCDGVEFDYEVEIGYEDVFDYVKPHNWKEWSQERKDAFICGFDALWDNKLVCLDDLENDKDFIEFMTDRYEEDARSACEEENS